MDTPAATASSAVTSMRCRSADQNQNQNSEFPNRDPREDKERFRPSVKSNLNFKWVGCLPLAVLS